MYIVIINNGKNSKLLYTDINSYFVEMRKDIYKIIKEYTEEFGTRDYDKGHEWCS